MGLDWNPGNKSKSGHEAEFESLFHALQEPDSPVRKLAEDRFFQISLSAFDTLEVQQVGSSDAADRWILEVYRREARNVTEEAWLDSFEGFYVVDLVPSCPGVPRYSNGSPGGYVERFSFRAQFLLDCEYIIGRELLESGYASKLNPEFLEHGRLLLAKFNTFVRARGFDPSDLDSDDPESPRFHADIVGCAARWCLFWARWGHTLDAYW